MTNALMIWTYDWVPDGPRDYVRDIRLRWACEKAGLDYDVKPVSFKDRGPDHIANQPIGQGPFLQDGDISIFESGPCLLHLARKSETLMPRDPKGEAEALEWTIAGLNTIEMVSVPWWVMGLSGTKDIPHEDWMVSRLGRLHAVLPVREWIAAIRFTVADIMMSNVLRMPKVLNATQKLRALRAYVDGTVALPAFKQAHANQKAHFAKADE